MQQITLTDEQLDAFSQAHDPVAVRDMQGRLRGYMAIVVGGEEIADAKRALASQEPRYTTVEVLARLRARGASLKPFTVLWRQTAIDQLTELWLAASDPAQVNGAVEAIDALLSTEPKGELTHELAEGLRTVTVLPLRVIYAVQEPDCIIDVATVRRAFLPTP